MVRRDDDAQLADLVGQLENFAHDVTVEFLDGLDFLRRHSFVAGLVGSLDMQKNKVLFGQRGPGGCDLARVVGPQVAGRTGDSFDLFRD